MAHLNPWQQQLPSFDNTKSQPTTDATLSNAVPHRAVGILAETMLIAFGAALLVVVVGALVHLLVALITENVETLTSLFVPALVVVFASLVPVVPNPVHALLLLLGLFGSTAVVYLIQHVEYLALVFLIVYVGALAILFLFVIMLLNVNRIMLADKKFVWTPILVASATMGYFLFLVLFVSLAKGYQKLFLGTTAPLHQTPDVYESLTAFVTTDVLGLRSLYTEHSPLFAVITYILLLAMIGAIVLAASTGATEENTTKTTQNKNLDSKANTASPVGVPSCIGSIKSLARPDVTTTAVKHAPNGVEQHITTNARCNNHKT